MTPLSSRLLRSLVFVPGSRPDWLASIWKYNPDAVIWDLEDAVANAQKDQARANIRAALSQLDPARQIALVRVNHISTGMLADDLNAIVVPGLAGLMVPKSEDPAEIRELDAMLTRVEKERGLPAGHIGLLIIIETAAAMYRAYDFAKSSPRVFSLVGGAGNGADANRALGYTWTPEGLETLYLRSKILMDARAAGIKYPVYAGWYDLHDPKGLEKDARMNRQLGYRGEILIHPSHVAIANQVFSPTPEEIDYHRRLVAAFREAESRGLGAVAFDGMMIDYAMVPTSEALLRIADQLEAQRGNGGDKA